MKPVTACAAALALCAALASCASAPPPVVPQQLLHDALFAPPTQPVDGAGVFTLSAAMLSYAGHDLSTLARQQDPRRALIDALYSKDRLNLDYDATLTRNAAEAFAARAGNCLSLVIMTAAFARHMGLPVSFQAVQTDDFYSRSGGLYLSAGHVNLVLGPPSTRTLFRQVETASLTIDFLPQEELGQQRTRPLQESTIVAMYLNNRAAETLTAGNLSDAYWFARAALLHDAAFFQAANTLGVIFHRAGQPAHAETAFRSALAGEPDNVSALSNLVQLLERQGRHADGQALAARLVRLQPVAPFHHFLLGQAAMAESDFAKAAEHFARELRLQPYQDEVHFWAAQAQWKLGNFELAARHLGHAVRHSPSRSLHDRYAAKLDHLRHSRLQ